MSHIYSCHIAIINCSNLGINFFFLIFLNRGLLSWKIYKENTERNKTMYFYSDRNAICGHTPSFLLCYHICRFLYHYKCKHLTYYRLCKRLTLLFDCHTSLIVALTCQFCVHVAKFPSLSLARYRSIYNSITFVI